MGTAIVMIHFQKLEQSLGLPSGREGNFYMPPPSRGRLGGGGGWGIDRSNPLCPAASFMGKDQCLTGGMKSINILKK